MSRFNFRQHLPVLQPLFTLSKTLRESSLEAPLRELVATRVSQINGCAFCLDMHSKDARTAGVTEQRLYLVRVWRETTLYSPRERAALGWAEAVTRIQGDDPVPDDAYEAARSQFSEDELVQLTLLITLTGTWNRINIIARTEGGGYKPGMFN